MIRRREPEMHLIEMREDAFLSSASLALSRRELTVCVQFPGIASYDAANRPQNNNFL